MAGKGHGYGRAAGLKGAAVKRSGALSLASPQGPGVDLPGAQGGPAGMGSHDIMPGETTPGMMRGSPVMSGAGPGAGAMTPDMGGPPQTFCAGGRAGAK